MTINQMQKLLSVFYKIYTISAEKKVLIYEKSLWLTEIKME